MGLFSPTLRQAKSFRRDQAFKFFKPVEDDVDLGRFLNLCFFDHHKVSIALDDNTIYISNVGDTFQTINLVEKGSDASLHDQRLVKSEAVGVAGNYVVGSIHLKENILSSLIRAKAIGRLTGKGF